VRVRVSPSVQGKIEMLLNKISTVKHRNLKEWCHAKRDAIFNF